MRHSLVYLFLLLITSTLLSGCGEQHKKSNGEDYQPVRLVMTANSTDNGIEVLTERKFSQLVEETSGGNVIIEFYPNDEMTGGNTNEAVRSLSEGAIDLGAYVSGTMSMLDTRLEVATIPWSFSSYQEARKIIDTTGGDYYSKVLAEYGLIYLGSTHNAMRQLSNNRNPVRAPIDLRSMRIRVLGGEVYRRFFAALGAEPVPLGWSELNIAIPSTLHRRSRERLLPHEIWSSQRDSKVHDRLELPLRKLPLRCQSQNLRATGTQDSISAA